MTNLLDGEPLATWMVARGLVDDARRMEEMPMVGGVSGLVVGVRDGSRCWVVKQALPRLAVAGEWSAYPRRSLVEAEALRYARSLTPEAVPRVVHVDPDRCVLVTEWVPGEGDLRLALLAQGPCPEHLDVLAQLGSVLATWHRSSVPLPCLVDGGDRLLDQLRITPYHRAAAAARPDLADRLLQLGEGLLARARGEILLPDGSVGARTFVHGDFSPKNVLLPPADGHVPVVIDFEVAHAGDPVLDVAFMLSHLVLKDVHLAAAPTRLRDCAAAFLHAYGDNLETVGGWTQLAAHVGALLVARVHGRSPATYLTDIERSRVSRIGSGLLADGVVDSIDDLFDLVKEAS